MKKGLFGEKSFTYAGMPSGSCFSIVVSWSHGYQSAAYNLFFPTDQKEIEILERYYEVRKVTPQQIEIADLS